MVHFHGETFSEGSGTFYDASVLSSVGEIIVVTFNYRLGMLGTTLMLLRVCLMFYAKCVFFFYF